MFINIKDTIIIDGRTHFKEDYKTLGVCATKYGKGLKSMQLRVTFWLVLASLEIVIGGLKEYSVKGDELNER